MAPEETRAFRRAGSELLKAELEVWVELAKMVATVTARAAGRR